MKSVNVLAVATAFAAISAVPAGASQGGAALGAVLASIERGVVSPSAEYVIVNRQDDTAQAIIDFTGVSL